eukprot:TRINITY_DN2079_c0_g2_i1.p1 TRINITY_DN2079_c0_g2~~TRINITY_DN2079_c0_g2_i1.p1  ORF type:complete len:645 (+),score=159.96 TRINITY_DN2079_c0_g2_i1:61-1995(+)
MAQLATALVAAVLLAAAVVSGRGAAAAQQVLTLGAAAAAAAAERRASEAEEVVALPNGDGSVRGVARPRRGWRKFLGIPFAAPPVGPLRFMPPQRNVRWGGTLDATQFRPQCMQAGGAPDWPGLNMTMSEDCLYLNVYAPLRPPNGTAPYAVIVYIFGGDDSKGGPNDRQLYAWHAVGEMRDVVYVIPDWRQGPLGTLGGRELGDAMYGDPGRWGGNQGFLDQQMALRWVRDNIRAFGGDPERVLLLGESSGAGSVAAHMAAPGSRGLFQRAAMQSGAFVPWGTNHRTVAQRNFDFVARVTGCDALRSSPAAAGLTDAERQRGRQVVECLQRVPTREMQRLITYRLGPFQPGHPSDGWGNATWAPNIDGVVLPEEPIRALEGGRTHAVPVLLGTNRNEGVAFASSCRTCPGYLSMTISEAQYVNWTRSNFPEPWASRILAQYSYEKHPLPFWAAAAAVGDYVVRCPVRRAARLLAARQNATFVYAWTHTPVSRQLTGGGPCAEGGQGAFHGAEVPFVFHSNHFFKTPAEVKLADVVSRYWRNFAYSGDPNAAPPTALGDPKGSLLTAWPRYQPPTQSDTSSDQELQLGTEPDGKVEVVVGVRSSYCGLWRDYAAAGEPVDQPQCRCPADLGPSRPDLASEEEDE